MSVKSVTAPYLLTFPHILSSYQSVQKGDAVSVLYIRDTCGVCTSDNRSVQ
jgi:hypothetical protein